MSTPLEAPRYGIAAGTVIRGSVYRATEIEHDGWPTPGMAPLNVSSRRIAEYHAAHRLDAFCPKTPWLAEHQTYYLPAVLPRMGAEMRVRGPRMHRGRVTFDGAGSELASPVPASAATPDMPRYRVRGLTQVGRHILEDPNETITFLGWPTEAFEPVGGAAEAVVAYAGANRGRTDMLPSPWCMYRRGLFLPALRELVQRHDGSFMEPPRPVDGAKYADAIASEVASVTGKRPGEPGSVPVSTRSGFSTHVGRAKPLADRR